MPLRVVARTAAKLNYYGLLNSRVNKTAVLSNFVGIPPEKKHLHTCRTMQKKAEVRIVVEKGAEEISLMGKEGDSVMDVIIDNNVDIPGYGACEGTLSCSTCHIKLTSEDFQKIPVGASDEELDMLDMAPDVCSTSRLGCQVMLCKELEGLRVKVPSEVKDQRDIPKMSL